MTPFMLSSLTSSPDVFSPDTLLPANDTVLPANSDVYSSRLSPETFDRLIQNLTEGDQNGTDQTQRLEMIRSAVDEMDESEVVGFLAMLENQAGWNPEDQGALEPFKPFNTLNSSIANVTAPLPEGVAMEPLQRQMADLQFVQTNVTTGQDTALSNVEVVQPENTLNVAVQEALNKASENYMPAVREQMDSDGKPLSGSVSELSSDFNTAVLRQTIQPSMLTIDSPQSGFELNLQDSSRIAPAQVKGEFSQLTQTTSEYLSDTRPLPDAREAGWGEALGQRLVMMVGEQRQEAQLRLDPPDLGSLGVKLVVEDRGVSIQFNSAIPQVRDMLEAQAERLRIAMAAQGLDLVDVNVADSPQEKQREHQQENQQDRQLAGQVQESGLFSSSEQDEEGQWSAADVVVPVSQNLINTFA